MINTILDPIFGPIAGLPSLLAIGIFSLIITLMTTLIYKFVTDQKKIKEIKDKLKDYQDELKTLKNDPEKALSVQKKAMEKNMEYMQQTMKATLFTFLPIILIFGWLNAHMAFMPIIPGQNFNVFAEFKDSVGSNVTLVVSPSGVINFATAETIQIPESGKAEWTLNGPKGEYILTYTYAGKSYDQNLIITEAQNYAPPQKLINDGNFVSGNIMNAKVMPLQSFGIKWGWLGTYILFSIVMSMGIRKILKVH